MLTKKDYLLIGLTCLVLGFVLVRQFYLYQQVKKVIQPETGNTIALEVAELFKTNSKLVKQIDKLKEQKDKLSKSRADLKTANEAIEENLANYEIILGLTEVKGDGVEITFNEKIDSTQLIDLVNAIKNIGAEAITVNNRRLAPTTSIESGIFYPPTTVQAIGNQESLRESLVRPGGIIDQIGIGEVSKKENIRLPSI